MSVEIFYKAEGRLGNNLFQYACARLFAERNGFQLVTPFPELDVIRAARNLPGRRFDAPTTFVTDEHDPFSGAWHPGRYVFDGYFQRSGWYHERKADILKCFELNPIRSVNRKDIVISLRIDKDYRLLNWIIDPSWYLDILAQESFERLHIVTDVRDEEYLSHFGRFEPIVVSSGPKGDWEYLRSFDRIVCSNSTFCWWAAFFSHATRIYTFRPWVIHPIPQIHAFPNGISVGGTFLHERRG